MSFFQCYTIMLLYIETPQKETMIQLLKVYFYIPDRKKLCFGLYNFDLSN